MENAIEELNERLGGLPSPKEAEFIWSDIWHLEAHHSTALEGNTLVLREVETLLEKGRAVGAKPLKEYMEVQGYGVAAQWVYSQALEPGDWKTDGLISVYEVRQVHHRAMSPVWEVAPHPEATPAESPGNFREHDIHAFDGGMTPPPWPLVPAEVDEWVAFINSHSDMLRSREDSKPWPERLAEVHNRFEQVHPFIDGNGRAGRLLLNLLLVRLGYPPVIVLKKQRPAYLKAMQRADDGDHGPLGELLARAMYDNLNRFIVPNVAGPARLVPLSALVDKELSLVALRHAARRGRLDAVHGPDGEWRSSRKAVDEYKKSRGRI
ncbi:Fic family protein [Nesterenkonia alkaliphila]|uniref:Fic family protein n=1 Tax=Nesterenkonia alkaliphila TaxID=1463631 RepID=UPI001E581E14|nr:Fic family protein [Nesterenkonia alkaliphila]